MLNTAGIFMYMSHSCNFCKFCSCKRFCPAAKMSEKLCLQWNDFQDNIQAAFKNLRQDKHFTDVTLASADGQQVEAHKVILAASSPFFQTLLEKNKHPHPLVYMRGLKSEDLVAIVDFLYFGEANVYQENLDSFLAIADEFQLKGLRGNGDRQVESDMFNDQEIKRRSAKPSMRNLVKAQEASEITQGNCETESSKALALVSQFSGNVEELEEKVNSMMQKSENFVTNGSRKADICKVCGKEGKGDVIKNHIEANHLEGVVIPCNHCEKTFRCRNTLKSHKHRYHRDFHSI